MVAYVRPIRPIIPSSKLNDSKPLVRDARIDLLRGFALIFIFVDHVPGNCLSLLTLRNFGFSDAAEMFVFLAGYSSVTAYGRTIDQEGWNAGLFKLFRRCWAIYVVHVGLLVATLLVRGVQAQLMGIPADEIGQLLAGGMGGVLRGFILTALPAYLDILPLYIVLIASFPLIWFGLRRSVAVTIASSLAIYAVSRLLQVNFPNQLDPSSAAMWSFNPLTWQVAYVFGAVFALGGANAFARKRAVRWACWGFLVFGLLALDAWRLWPPLFGTFLDGASLSQDGKTFLSPLRLLHNLALMTVLLTSVRLGSIARAPSLEPVVACGRHSLPVFAIGCLLSLLGRILFQQVGLDLPAQFAVNTGGLFLMLTFGAVLNQRKLNKQRAATMRRLVMWRETV